MDRSYKEDIPKNRRVLEQLKKEFLCVAPTPDWTKLRIEPLLEHVKFLRPLSSVTEIRARDCTVEKGSHDVLLRPGLPLGNVKELKEILEVERRPHPRRRARRTPKR